MIDDFIYKLKLLWGDVTPEAKMVAGVIVVVMLVLL